MPLIKGRVDRPYTVESDTELTGMITENTTILPGVTFVVRGMITADLLVQEGATAIIHGMVNGRVVNSGRVEIFGVIDSLVENSGSILRIAPDGKIRDR